MADSFDCPNCLKSCPVSQRLLLWDGRAYCTGCVRSFSPRLAEYAAAHPRWEESAPWRLWAVWRKALLTEAGIFLLFGSLVAWTGYQERGPMGILAGFAVTAFICCIQGGMQLPAFVWTTRRSLPTVVIENGVVSAHRGGRRNWCPAAYPLLEMTWRLGKPRHDSMLSSGLMPRQPVVILTYTRKVCSICTIRIRTACGWDDETRQVLIDFLTFCGVPRG